VTEAISVRSLLWQIVILVFSVVTLLFLAIDTLFAVTDETAHLFFIIDTAICMVFLADVAYRGLFHPDRRQYWRWGWVDLISSIPAIAFLRWGRLIRVIRIFRVLRAFRSTRAVIGYLFRDPAKGSAFTVALATFTLVVFGSVAILNLESTSPDTNIRTASDALWWSFVTVTTVGYGDHYPITGAGRLVAALLMGSGVGLFGTLTAYLANAWLTRPQPPSEQDDDPNDITALKVQLAVVLAKLERLEATADPTGQGPNHR
jgi:voltage-gated potassium channel